MALFDISGIGFDLLPDAEGNEKFYLTFTASIPLIRVGEGFTLRDSVLNHLRGLWSTLSNSTVEASTKLPQKGLYLLGNSYKDFAVNFRIGKIEKGDIRLLNYYIDRSYEDPEDEKNTSRHRFTRHFNFTAPDKYQEEQQVSQWEIHSPTKDFDAGMSVVFEHDTQNAYVVRWTSDGPSVHDTDGYVTLYGRLVIARDVENRKANGLLVFAG